MWGRRKIMDCSLLLAAVLLPFLQLVVGLVTSQISEKPTASSPWLTLEGNTPLVIAKGGFSGLFPDSSAKAYSFTYIAGSADTVSWCDMRLTKDNVGICVPDIKLDNSTNIATMFPDGKRSYIVNGVQTTGWFPVDYTMEGLSNVSLNQGIYIRSDKFDSSERILAVEDVQSEIKPPSLWLNVEHDLFYRQHNLSMRRYVVSLSKRVIFNYVSSPEIGFLMSISQLTASKTKLIFRFPGDKDIFERTTNQPYGSLLKNFTFIKSFASGILVPKHYIWPVTSDLYLQKHTAVVLDAHKEGLEVFASGFANDFLFSYNYSSDPLAEYLSFVDNGVFSVDGVVTDFPITGSEAIDCFSHTNQSISGHEKPVIISHNGASGVYPDCTNLAYQNAVEAGADVIDCPVQLTKDGVPICMSSINLMDDTTVTASSFSSRSSVIPELQETIGIFTFNLTWDEIGKNLKPAISTPDSDYKLSRNPRYKNAGNFMKLTDFLAFAKDKDLSGVLIKLEHAAFWAEKIGIDVVDAVIEAVKLSGYSNQTRQQVMIQSANSSVLIKFKQQTDYKLVYIVDESIRDVDASSLADIKSFADAVSISKTSIYPEVNHFITGQTGIVTKLQSAGLVVYAHILRNEFTSQPWDFFSDPTVEINTFVKGARVDGIITDFPGTAAAYKRNTCLKMGNDGPNFMNPVQVGGLLQIIEVNVQPPALAPYPVLDLAHVVEPPLPSSTSVKPTGSGSPNSQPSSTTRCSRITSVYILLMIVFGFLLV